MLPELAQGLPPIPDPSGLDVGQLLTNVGLALLWTVVAGLCFGVAVSMGMRLLQALLPELDVVQELKRANLAVAVFSAAFLICLAAIVVAVLLK